MDSQILGGIVGQLHGLLHPDSIKYFGIYDLLDQANSAPRIQYPVFVLSNFASHRGMSLLINGLGFDTSCHLSVMARKFSNTLANLILEQQQPWLPVLGRL